MLASFERTDLRKKYFEICLTLGRRTFNARQKLGIYFFVELKCDGATAPSPDCFSRNVFLWKGTSVLQELQSDLDIASTRNQIRERMREYADTGAEPRTPQERADDAWRLVQNVLAEEIGELNSGLDGQAQIL